MLSGEKRQIESGLVRGIDARGLKFWLRSAKGDMQKRLHGTDPPEVICPFRLHLHEPA